jgi:capsular polysaccharide export protein
MLSRGLDQLKGKRVLLLQGPVGPFFARFAQDLRLAGAQVFKVNFNAGDWFYYPQDAINYRGTMADWPGWFDALIRRLDIDVVYLFGDCRPIHQAASFIVSQYNIEIGVFEEGYIRPDYVTLERFGVNGYSRRSRNPDDYADEPPVPKKLPVGNTYWAMVRYGFWYFLIGALGKPWFWHYQHHRPLNLLEAPPWWLSAGRKLWYRWTERGVQTQLTTQWKKRFFLVPLQVFNDSQLTEHADFSGVEHFIEITLCSFAHHAPANTLLVFKHHPMDRGHREYSALIKKLARDNGVAARVRYIHDQHLPSLLDHVRGVVVVNSTVGLSALYHDAPTKVCGNALYDLPGLTFQGPLDKFWSAAPRAKPDRSLYTRFRDHLVSTTQINGSFYKPIDNVGSFTGLVWPAEAQPDEASAEESAQPIPGWLNQPG